MIYKYVLLLPYFVTKFVTILTKSQNNLNVRTGQKGYPQYLLHSLCYMYGTSDTDTVIVSPSQLASPGSDFSP